MVTTLSFSVPLLLFAALLFCVGFIFLKRKAIGKIALYLATSTALATIFSFVSAIFLTDIAYSIVLSFIVVCSCLLFLYLTAGFIHRLLESCSHAVENGELAEPHREIASCYELHFIHKIIEFRANSKQSSDYETHIALFVEQAREAKKQIHGLMALTEQFTFFAKTMSKKIQTISEALEHINSSVASLTQIANNSNVSLSELAAATEELTATTENISQLSNSADKITQEAVDDVAETIDIVSSFNQSTNEIETIVKMIVEIADQTKMLALNASIEAARAGDMGKGFAIVASEVDELASQTNSSLDGISEKVQHMRNVAVNAIEEINRIKSVIYDVKRQISDTSFGVAQQNESAKVISNTTQSVAGEINLLYTSTQDLGTFSKEILKSMESIASVGASVEKATKKNRELIDQMLTGISGLSQKSELANIQI